MKVYGAFWCDCVYEGGMSLVTAHLTKKGAYNAIRKILLDEWERHRIGQLTGGYNYEFCDKATYDKPMELKNTKWEISEIEILG